MIVITALFDKSDRGYKDMVANLEKSVKNQGYEFKVFSLKEDPMLRYNTKDNYFVPCYFKPKVIRDALEHYRTDILWLDGDCLMKSRVDEMLGGVDVAVTLRRPTNGSLYDGYINAGVMAFRNTQRAFGLLRQWEDMQQHSRADQDAMNRLLLNHSKLDKYNELINVEGCFVKVLPCEVYNFFYFEEPDNAKIYHVKGHLRPQYYQKILEMVGM